MSVLIWICQPEWSTYQRIHTCFHISSLTMQRTSVTSLYDTPCMFSLSFFSFHWRTPLSPSRSCYCQPVGCNGRLRRNDKLLTSQRKKFNVVDSNCRIPQWWGRRSWPREDGQKVPWLQRPATKTSRPRVSRFALLENLSAPTPPIHEKPRSRPQNRDMWRVGSGMLRHRRSKNISARWPTPYRFMQQL